MVIELTSGRRFRGRYAAVTEVRIGDVALSPVNTARHCRYRAFGLAIRPLCASVYGVDQAVYVSSGVAVLPDRVDTCTCPGFAVARHRNTPQLATVEASRTSDS